MSKADEASPANISKGDIYEERIEEEVSEQAEEKS